jgi:hypothetical protein
LFSDFLMRPNLALALGLISCSKDLVGGVRWVFCSMTLSPPFAPCFVLQFGKLGK